MFKALLIEDSLEASEKLQFLLKKYCTDTVKLLDAVTSGQAGIVSIETNRPDLIFLDIELGDMTAFEMLERLDTTDFKVIFITAHNHYAIKAIRYSAVDYLLKPIGREELITAIGRVEKKTLHIQREQLNHLTQQSLASTPEKIALTTSDGLIFKKTSEIIRCESERMYTVISMADGQKLMVSKPMGQLEEILKGADFFRVHNSHLINMNRIKKFVRADGGYLLMEDDATVSVARHRKEAFLELFSKF